MTSSVLAKIAESTRHRIDSRRNQLSLLEIERKAMISRNPHDFKLALVQGDRPRVIAEVKSKSPSKGVIRESTDPVEVALGYQQAGAAAISVLTEPDYFGGKIENLIAIREKSPSSYLLQKDFILSSYQIFEARVYGADAILLILSLLDHGQAKEFMSVAHSLGLTCLVEVHDENEMERALNMEAPLIGVNNRNLKTLEISLDVSRKLASMIPQDRIVISESGVERREQIDELLALGYRGFLVGTSLMKNDNPAMALARLIERPSR